jgi:hypothetical protein
MRRWLRINGAPEYYQFGGSLVFGPLGLVVGELPAERRSPRVGAPVIMSKRYSGFLRHQGSDQSEQLVKCQEINLDV